MKSFLNLRCFEELMSYDLDKINSIVKVDLLFVLFTSITLKMNAGGAAMLWRLFCTNFIKSANFSL